MPPRLTVETEIYASHHQFYVVDVDAEHRAGDVWDGHGLERHLGVAEGIVAVGTAGYCDVPVTIELWDAEPELDLEAWDHVVDASLVLGSGRLGLHSVEGPAELESLVLDPGAYRVRSSVAGLDGADETDGGDRYRLQVWPAPAADPDVRTWWPPWNPSSAVPQPTTSSGRLLVGAEAADRRVQMSWLASRGSAHLFRDDDGACWEHSNLRDAQGTPQLEELTVEEAESRYGSSETWAPPMPGVPSTGTMLRNIVQTLRYQRGWRPRPEPEERMVDGKRVLLGGEAITKTRAMSWVASVGGDNLHVDDDGTYWEWENEDAASGRPQLRELAADEARAKYGLD